MNVVLEEVTQHIEKWIARLSEPLPQFDNLPTCPFAMRALVEHRVDVKLYRGGDVPLWSLLLGRIILGIEPGHVLIAADLTIPTLDAAELVVEIANREARKRDLVVLLDHPAEEYEIAGVKTGNGKYVLYMIQRLSELQNASESLKATGYYARWSKQNLEDVVNWRGQ